MNLHEQEAMAEAVEGDADALTAFVSGLDTQRLCMLGKIVNEELALRCEGKPEDRKQLH